MTPKLKNLAFFEKDKSLGVFAEVQDINENILALTEAVKAIPPVEFPEIPEMPEPLEEVSIKNFPEKQKVEVTNFPTMPEHKAPVVNVPAPIVNVEAPIVNVDAPIVNIDNEGVEKEIKKITDILSKEKETEIEKVTLVDKNGKPIDFLLNAQGGYTRGPGTVGVSNRAETRINPATEEKQDTLNASVSQLAMAITNAIDQTAYDLNAALFSATTNVTNDYILDSIELNFTTTESKTITVTTADGTILYQDTNINTNVSLTEIDQAFNGGENITVAVTQTAGACSMDCVLKVKQGSNTLVGNPVLGAGTATIGIVDQGVAGTDPWLTVDIVHQRVHQGRYFSGGYYNGAVADAGTIELLVQIGAEPTHAVFQSSVTGDSYLQIFEGATFSAAGTAVPMSNHNRSSAKAFVGTVTHTPTITGTGTQINGTGLIPGGTKSAGGGGEFNGFVSEFLLAPSTVYLLRVTNVAGGAAKMDVHMDCYQPNL